MHTTKEYILHEYADVFKRFGTLPGSPYHIKFKDSYKPVQNPPRSVPLGMQTACKAELDRLVKEGIITEVHKHTEWINYSPSDERRWKSKTMPRPKRLEQGNQKKSMVCKNSK